MLVDANILLFAVDDQSPFHAAAATWLAERLNGARRVGIPWQSIGAFLRISTHPRAAERALSPPEACRASPASQRRIPSGLHCARQLIPLR